MKRVYLAKSNKANPNLVSAVRQTLAKFNVQVVEFTGGTYSHDLLLSCDELYVIPDLSGINVQDEYDIYWSVPLGKGLYEQIQAFNKSHNHNDIFIVTDYDGAVGVGGVYYDDDSNDSYSIEVSDETDYVTYAYFMVNTKNCEINPWELYDYVLETNDIKDESWVSNALTESIDEHKTWKGKDERKKFMVLLSKK